MTGLIMQPVLIATAATDVAEIELAIGAAKTAAAGPTTGLLAAAQDEVSAAAAALFGEYGKGYQALLKQAEAFHEQFTSGLAAAANGYLQTEASNALTVLSDPAGTITTLVLGASGYPIPSQEYIDGIPKLYIDPFYGAGTNVGVNTPEGLYPLTGVKSLTFNTSVSQGLTILNNDIQALATPARATRSTSSVTRRAPPSCRWRCTT